MAPTPYVLDTNILVHLTRDDATGKAIKARYDLLMTDVTPALCVVTDGEIRSLAYQFQWGEDRRTKMRFFLSYFRRLPIDTLATVEAYAVMDAHSRRLGIKMGKNDLWIAAAAYENDFTILTTDHDFGHLHPDVVTVEKVELIRRSPTSE